MSKTIKIALAGNPNTGKSCLFNNLTGMKQHVGNWPGKTVEKKEGRFSYKSKKINIIDLPGTYSLTAYSMEELVARDFIVDEAPDVVVNIVDAVNLERNLYLTTQLIELGANVILAVNMNKLAQRREIFIDEKRLSKLLGIPVVKIEAVDETGKKDLIQEIIKVSENKVKILNKITYGKEIEEHLDELEGIVKEKITIEKHLTPRWIALKILENDKQVVEQVLKLTNGKKVLSKAKEIQKHLSGVFGEDIDTAVADARYGFISGLVKDSLKKPKIDRLSMSDKIDKVVTNKFLGIPIFLFAMWLLFQLTFTISAPFMNWIDAGIGWLGGTIGSLITTEWLSSLIADGIIGGVGAVLVFVPPIFILFLAIALLEDSGYLARAAFIMDKLMHKLGLHGKSFIPMLLGFGCNVPAVMATRTLESKKDRLLTMLINPFMSCGARLPVYILFAGAFFSAHQGLVVFSLYMLGIIVAIIMGLIFKHTMFKGLSAPFVMELPPYRLPTIKGALIHMWERGSLFLKKAGTIIFGAVIIIWLLSSLPIGVEYASEQSVIGMIGKGIAPIFKPLGFGTWQAATSLIFGFVAKEVVVGTFGTLYGVTEAALGNAIQGTFTPLSAYAFMVFVLLYVPCMAVVAVIKRETNSWKWPLFTAAYTTVVAWIVAFIVYQGGLLIGFT